MSAASVPSPVLCVIVLALCFVNVGQVPLLDTALPALLLGDQEVPHTTPSVYIDICCNEEKRDGVETETVSD